MYVCGECVVWVSIHVRTDTTSAYTDERLQKKLNFATVPRDPRSTCFLPSQRECLSVFVAVSTCEIRDLLNTQQERHQPKFCFIRFQREQFSFRNKRLSCSHDCSWSDQRASAFHRCAAYSVFTLTVTTNNGESPFPKFINAT